MSYFKLLNQRAVERATSALFSAIAKDHKLEDFAKLCRDNALLSVKVQLPSFTLFDQGPGAPLPWFLPRVKMPTSELLRIYERMVDQPERQLESMGEIVSLIYPRASEERKLLAKFNLPEQWLSPALIFAALTVQVGAEIISYGPADANLHFGTGKIQITPEALWSNTSNTWVETNHQEMTELPATFFPGRDTAHPVLRAMRDLGSRYDLAHVATVVALALHEGLLSKTYLGQLARLEGPVINKVRNSSGRSTEKAAAALDNCLAILAEAKVNVVQELFAAAVPDLLGYREMQAITGPPSQVKPGRVHREETLEVWAVKLRKAFQEVVDANP